MRSKKKLPKLMFERALEKPIDQRFVIGAFDREKLIGICGFVPFAPDIIHGPSNVGTIVQMFVKSDYAGRKIGHILVRTTIRMAFKISDIEQIMLGVNENNKSAIRVYEQAGFKTFNSEFSKNGYRNMIIRSEDQAKYERK